MSALAKIEYLSEEDYLYYELSSPIKHEYVDGQIYAMAGASVNHNLINTNIFFHLQTGARGNCCKVFINDMKLRVFKSHSYYYPDVMLVCKDSSKDDEYYKNSPCFIAEVLSKSTRKTDQREKLLNYQKIASLRYYLMVDSTKRHVEYLQRDESGFWQRAILEKGETLTIQCNDDYQVVLTLDLIYEDINLVSRLIS